MGMVDVLILGLLSEKPRHGYGINREIDSRGYRQWVKASTVAVYKALSRLEKAGLLASITEKGGLSPERCVYSLTESGRERLADLLFDQLSSREPLRNEFYLPLEFLHGLDRNELILALEKRLEALERLLNGRRMRLDMLKDLEDELTVSASRHEIEVYELEIGWLVEMLVIINRR